MARSLQDFADNITRSYKTVKTASDARAKLDRAGDVVIIVRSDGRFSLVALNIETDCMFYFIDRGVGVWSIA